MQVDLTEHKWWHRFFSKGYAKSDSISGTNLAFRRVKATYVYKRFLGIPFARKLVSPSRWEYIGYKK